MYTSRILLDETKMKHIVIERQLEAMQESVHRARARTQPHIIEILAPKIGPVVYPIDWTSNKQQRKFFVTDGFGGGIPYQRTGDLNEGWRSESQTISGLGTSIFYWNTVLYTKFVVGTFLLVSPMQRFHRNTGWQPVVSKVDTIKQILIAGILKEFKWIVA